MTMQNAFRMYVVESVKKKFSVGEPLSDCDLRLLERFDIGLLEIVSQDDILRSTNPFYEAILYLNDLSRKSDDRPALIAWYIWKSFNKIADRLEQQWFRLGSYIVTSETDVSGKILNYFEVNEDNFNLIKRVVIDPEFGELILIESRHGVESLMRV